MVEAPVCGLGQELEGSAEVEACSMVSASLMVASSAWSGGVLQVGS